MVMLSMWLLKEDVSQRLSEKGKHNQDCFRISMFSGLLNSTKQWNSGPAIYYNGREYVSHGIIWFKGP